MANHNDLGVKGEGLAAQYLLENEYEILERNWRFQKAEVDIIAQKNDFIIAIEVKTRASSFFGNPEEFITEKKKKLLIYAMNEYVISKKLENEVQFDIIGIIMNKDKTVINHTEKAFLQL